MAPLSDELAGVILPHDHFGSHLDHNRKTIDEAVELANFRFAGETLAEIWNDGELLSTLTRPSQSYYQTQCILVVLNG